MLDVPVSFFFDDTDPVRAPAIPGGFAEPPAEAFESDPLRRPRDGRAGRRLFRDRGSGGAPPPVRSREGAGRGGDAAGEKPTRPRAARQAARSDLTPRRLQDSTTDAAGARDVADPALTRRRLRETCTLRKHDFVFTSESVSEGHPDKICDRISDAIVDTFLAAEPQARCGVETLVTTNRVVLAGETRGPASITGEQLIEVARQAIREIGYEQDNFHWQHADVSTATSTASRSISRRASMPPATRTRAPATRA